MSRESVIIPVGLTNIHDYHELSNFKKSDEFPYSGLWVFTGAQGNGKTLLLMHILREMLQEYPQAIVVSNIAIYGIPSFSYSGINDFDKFHNGKDGIIFVIDEIQTLYTSIVNEKLPPEMIEVWSQNRKNRRVILGTSQRFSRIAKPLREQTKLLYVCYPSILCFHRYSCFDASLINDSGEYEGPAEKKHYYVPSFKGMTMYNTLEVVHKNRSSFSVQPDIRANRISEIESYLKEVKQSDSTF